MVTKNLLAGLQPTAIGISYRANGSTWENEIIVAFTDRRCVAGGGKKTNSCSTPKHVGPPGQILGFIFHRGPAAHDGDVQICGNACRREGQPNEVGKFEDAWIWLSQDLPSLFDAHVTCQALRNRTVLILGDSTAQQTAATLMNALKIGGCAPQIIFQLTDTLIKQNLGVMNRGVYWLDSFRRLHPDIVIMGAGAHIATNSSFVLVLDQVISEIKTFQQQQAANNNTKSVSFVWKTQQPPGCTKNIFDPDNPLRAAAKFNFSGKPQYKRWHYDLFYGFDKYAIERWMTELLNESAYIFDLRMLYSRSDAHPGSGRENPTDCLHFLSPGPLDVVAPLFQRLLDEMNYSDIRGMRGTQRAE